MERRRKQETSHLFKRSLRITVVRYAVPWYYCCAVRCAMVLYAVPLVSSLWLQGSVYLISMVPLQPWCIYRAPHSIISQSIIIHNIHLSVFTILAIIHRVLNLHRILCACSVTPPTQTTTPTPHLLTNPTYPHSPPVNNS